VTAQTAQGKTQTKTQGKKSPKRKPGPAPRRAGSSWVFPVVIIAVVLVGVIAIVVARSGGSDGGSGGGGGGKKAIEVSAEVSVDGTALPAFNSGATKDAAVGLTAPTIGSVDFQGNNVQVGGATGSPYAVVFLAHWCPHCQAEVPRLVSLAKNGQIEGVDVTAVATGTSDQAPNYPPSAWLAREEWPFPVMVDTAAATAAKAYGLSGYPYMVFVDASGKVVGRTSGEIEAADLQKIFKALAAGETLPIPGAGASSSAN